MSARTDHAVATCPFTGRTAAAPAGHAASAAPARPAGSTAKAGPLGLRRRSFLGAALGLSVLKAVGGLPGTVAAFAAGTRATKGTHGQALRGIYVAAKVNRSSEARFGLMFKKLAAFNPSDTLLKQLAAQMNDGKSPLSDVKLSDTSYDTAIPAGYVYVGQFLDHDITRDTTPLTTQKQDVNAMVNFDSPKLDLGSVYGGGPTANPELYDPAKPGYLLVNWHDDIADLPRDAVGAAFVGDPRNDENLIVAQLHTVFLRLHNKFRDQGMTFEAAQQQTRWYFQWLVVNDYLPRVVGQSMVNSIVKKKTNGTYTANNLWYKPKNTAKPYIPIEFSGAAYRFGHSQIRAEYEMQDGHTVPIFAQDGYEDLRGSRPVPHNLWADWNYFFDIPGLSSPDDRNMARKIDTQISLPLSKLPSTIVANTAGAIVALAERNLLRGKRIGLPSGQDLAKAMGATVLTNAQIGLTDTKWKNKAPLWYYLLAEAELTGGQGLGPCGGRIVAEVILGLIAADKTSYWNAAPTFNPGAGFTFGSLVLLADALDPRGQELENAPEVPEPTDPVPDPTDPVPDPTDPVPDPVPDPTDPVPTDPEPTTPEPVEPVPVDPDEVINPEAVEPLPGDV